MISRKQLIALGSAVGLIAVLAIGWQWMMQPEMNSIAIPEPTTSTVTSHVIVDVAGAVRKPGIVELPLGSRVIDAIEAAGGVKPHRTAGVNLARVLVDGEQIVVGETSTSTSSTVNLNRASVAQLDELPGIGPVMAQRIVDYRQEHGPFTSVDQLDAVSGIGPALLAKIKGSATVG